MSKINASSFLNKGTQFIPSQSLRFEDGDSARLVRTFSNSSSTWTWSAWVKRGNLGSDMLLFGYFNGSPENFELIRFDSSDRFWWYQRTGSTGKGQRKTSAVFRDVSAWYHFVVKRSGTSLNMYVNGEELTTFDTSETIATDSYINEAFAHQIGERNDGNNEFDGYLANVTFIDGQALTPTSFGEYDGTLWKPKDVSGLTFGTNGFFLDFSDSSAIGDDISGNSNDWTANNLVATDVVLDAPLSGNNFATLNSLDKVGVSLSEGNLKSTATASSFQAVRSTITYPSGSWYVEVRSDAGIGNGNSIVGITRPSDALSTMTGSNIVGTSSTAWSYASNGNIYNSNAVDTATGTTWSAGAIIGVAFDGSSVKFYKNNSLIHTESSLTGDYVLTLGSYSTDAMTANFGQDSSFAGNETPQGNTDDGGVGDFYYTPPSGFLALTTGNLPPATITAPDEYFNTVLWAGNNTTGHAITGVNFQSDWTWIKLRNGASGHRLVDSVRGVTKYLDSTGTSAETTNTDRVTSFDSDGFTLGNSATVNGSFNYVAWNWLAGGTAVSNTSGTITSQVSANTDAGFSIVGWTSPGSGSNTIGHGLSSPPEMIITKTRTASIAYNWNTYHVGTHPTSPQSYFVALNSTAARGSSSTAWDNTAPTASVFSVNSTATVGASGDAMIAYCFHSVPQYSKCGVYTGNGSTDGTFVHCGFRPAWVMVKSYDNTRSWTIFDNKRTPINEMDGHIHASSSVAEQTGTDEIDFLSNGFKFRSGDADSNYSNFNYIFLAFAESPFRNANAR